MLDAPIIRAAALAALASLTLPATADDDGKAPLSDLVDTSWKLIALNGNPTDPEVQSTLTIEADSIGGNGGCNTFGGQLTATDTGIDFTNVFSTMMACDNQEQEDAYFAAIEAATGYAIVESNLQLTGPGGEVLAELEPAS